MDTSAARRQAAEGVEVWRSTLFSTFSGRRPQNDLMNGDPGAGAVILGAGINALRGRKMDTQKPSLARWREIVEEANEQATKAVQGYRWVEQVKLQLERAPWQFTPADRSALQARIRTVNGKIAECLQRVEELEAQEEEAIREYLQGYPDGRFIIERTSDGKRVIFSVRPMMNAPYPVWTPPAIAAALRIGAVFTKDERAAMDFYVDPLRFLAEYGHADPLEKARVTCGKPGKHPRAKPVAPKEDLFGETINQDTNDKTGFGTL